MTQLLARFTTVLDGRKTVKMTGRVYLRAIVPIGLMFSLSLICGNMTYLYLSVAFIQMLKVRFKPDGQPVVIAFGRAVLTMSFLTTIRLPPPLLFCSLPGAWAWPLSTTRFS
jgi:hypothetical protein